MPLNASGFRAKYMCALQSQHRTTKPHHCPGCYVVNKFYEILTTMESPDEYSVELRVPEGALYEHMRHWNEIKADPELGKLQGEDPEKVVVKCEQWAADQRAFAEKRSTRHVAKEKTQKKTPRFDPKAVHPNYEARRPQRSTATAEPSQKKTPEYIILEDSDSEPPTDTQDFGVFNYTEYLDPQLLNVPVPTHGDAHASGFGAGADTSGSGTAGVETSSWADPAVPQAGCATSPNTPAQSNSQDDPDFMNWLDNQSPEMSEQDWQFPDAGQQSLESSQSPTGKGKGRARSQSQAKTPGGSPSSEQDRNLGYSQGSRASTTPNYVDSPESPESPGYSESPPEYGPPGTGNNLGYYDEDGRWVWNPIPPLDTGGFHAVDYM